MGEKTVTKLTVKNVRQRRSWSTAEALLLSYLLRITYNVITDGIRKSD